MRDWQRRCTEARVSVGELFDLTGAGDRHILCERLVLRVLVRELSGYVVYGTQRQHVRHGQYHLWADRL